MHCQNCQQENPAEARFCMHCSSTSAIPLLKHGAHLTQSLCTEGASFAYASEGELGSIMMEC